ncbi:nuclear transport factor 2 family protein [Sphingomonas sp. LY29]|uniref:nuclear transport factor 2 family protein n=1 Tax=unclassified Sphingomonas TaxID=196159 RepID=UPI002ADEC00D|nr:MULTISPECIES: nuclear transport factor 2 family protein [unclassified Sphingomonas]MEA1072769.1 nuclear transport factor 2 family protein [Sphingomonas sp. LY160]WRP26925.1 nuclear transport factor 2 family protein [Sphingomonas sp. LY29]
MADLLPVIETLENRWMRAWVGGDTRALKSLTSRNFRMVFATKPSMILDSNSWIEAARTRIFCSSYRFGDIYVRKVGGMAVFATRMELEATIDDHQLSGEVWVTDLWQKSTVTRGWRMMERLLSRPESDEKIPALVRPLQLWRR